MRREGICKCGLRVIRDDAALTIMHETPECEWFKGLIAKARGRGAVVRDEIVKEQDIDAYLRMGRA